MLGDSFVTELTIVTRIALITNCSDQSILVLCKHPIVPCDFVSPIKLT